MWKVILGGNVDFNSMTQTAKITAGTNSSTINITVINDAGEIDVAKGVITLHSFAVNAATDIRLTVVPNSLDLAPSRNQLISIDATKVNITPEIDTIAVAGSSGAINYNTTARIK